MKEKAGEDAAERVEEEDHVAGAVPRTLVFCQEREMTRGFLAGKVEVKSMYMSLDQICILENFILAAVGDKILK